MRIDPDVKEGFKQETYMQGVDMTETIERFMINYIKASKDGREAKG